MTPGRPELPARTAARPWRIARLPFLAGLVIAALGLVGSAGMQPASAATGYSVTCTSPGYGYSCVSESGYTGQSTWGYPVDSRGHNCTNYVAYRLAQNGAANPGNLGNANNWDNSASAKGFVVDGNPAVGSVAQWEANTGPAAGVPEGHVAYVEAVTDTYIDISQDAWGGTTSRARIMRGGSHWPSHFIHIKDKPVTPPTPSPSKPNGITGVPNGSSLRISWSPSTNTTGYEVYQDGRLVGVTAGTSLTDATTTRAQTYHYSVIAVGPGGRTSSDVVEVQNRVEDGARTWLATKYGPALCGRSGDNITPRLTCTVRTGNGWRIYGVPQNLDWGYPQNRSWLTVNGKATYCGLTGDPGIGHTSVACISLGEKGWGKQSYSPDTDWTYETNA